MNPWLLLNLPIALCGAFLAPRKAASRSPLQAATTVTTVPVAELERDLTEAEKTVTAVVRRAGPSVAFITSVLPRSSDTASSSSPPAGQSLGSGSGFVVDSEGYCVTNFHVIERAYQLQETQRQTEMMLNNFVGNLTSSCHASSALLNTTNLQQQLPFVPPRVYCRINSKSTTQYQPCRIVKVQPDLDVAVLKIENSSITEWPTVDFGTSGDLLVGQSLVAIGNPFGLDQSVTTGVVSALDRDIQTSGAGKIRNCIQTDCAINPGNSGGPLLNLQRQVIGVNTAIVTTSGSSAGIGFAIPSDKVQPVVREFIRLDRSKTTQKVGYLGVRIAKHLDGNKIVKVDADSPAERAGLKTMTVEGTGSVSSGDSIYAVGGNFCETYEQLVRQLEVRVPGEEVALTIENSAGDRRVVYIKLSESQS